MWFIGVEVEQETSAPRPKKNPGSAPVGSEKARVNGEGGEGVPLLNWYELRSKDNIYEIKTMFTAWKAIQCSITAAARGGKTRSHASNIVPLPKYPTFDILKF